MRKAIGKANFVSCAPTNRHVSHGARLMILRNTRRQLRHLARLELRQFGDDLEAGRVGIVDLALLAIIILAFTAGPVLVARFAS